MDTTTGRLRRFKLLRDRPPILVVVGSREDADRLLAWMVTFLGYSVSFVYKDGTPESLAAASALNAECDFLVEHGKAILLVCSSLVFIPGTPDLRSRADIQGLISFDSEV